MRPTELLSQDHQVILQMLKVIEGMAKRIGSGQDVEIEHLDGVVEFIRAFADKCHHAKEENLLFPAMEAAGIPKDGGPVGVMLVEHVQGREYVKGMAEGIEEYRKGNRDGLNKFAKNGSNYSGLLSEHIYKEDNILYMMANMHLDEEADARLLREFERVEKEVVGEGKHEEFHALVDYLSGIYAGGSHHGGCCHH